ncbi:MAG: DMT family transporter [Pseudomonadota bacterium]
MSADQNLPPADAQPAAARGRQTLFARNAQWMPWLLLMGAGTIWGATFALARLAAESDFHPLTMNAWQSFVGVVILLAVHAVQRRGLPFGPQERRFYVVCGLIGTALPGALYYYAARHVPSGVLAITIATVPMITLVLAHLAKIERASALRSLGVALGVVAVALLVLPDASLPDPAAAPWVLLALVCALSYAVENIYIARAMPQALSSLSALLGMLAAGGLMTAAVAIPVAGLELPRWPLQTAEIAIVLMGLINVIAYSSFVFLIRIAGPVFASQMGYVVTLSGVAWGIAIFAEVHSGWVWGALVLMLVGLALVTPRRDAETNELDVSGNAKP